MAEMSKAERIKTQEAAGLYDMTGQREDAAWDRMLIGLSESIRPNPTGLYERIRAGMRRAHGDPSRPVHYRQGNPAYGENAHCVFIGRAGEVPEVRRFDCPELAARFVRQMTGKPEPRESKLSAYDAASVLAAFPRLARDPGGDDDGSDVGDRWDDQSKRKAVR